jgi:hypothetical protein
MYYDIYDLTKIATDAQLNINLGDMGPRTSKAVIKAFDKGYLTSVRGEAAMYHAVLADKLGLPIMQFSKKGKWWDTLYLKNMDARCIPQLSEWWQTDRVLYRLENPEDYNKIISTKNDRYPDWRCKDYLLEPDWQHKVKSSHKEAFHIRILGGKELEMFDLIAKEYVKTDEYKENKEKLIHMIESKEVIKVNYEFRSK